MSALSCLRLAAVAGNLIRTSSVTLSLSLPRELTPTLTIEGLQAVSQGLHWLGVLYALGAVVVGSWFFVLALMGAILRVKKPRAGYSVGIWAIVFPVGAFAMALGEVGKVSGRGGKDATVLPGQAFAVWSAIFGALCLALWIVCVVWCLIHAGSRFFSPKTTQRNNQRVNGSESPNPNSESELAV